MADSLRIYPTLRQANQARQLEWDGGKQIDASYRGNELAGEVGEACNVIKKLERERLGIRGSRATVDQLADELADVLICADLIALHYGINLEFFVAEKFNATSEKIGLATRLTHDPDAYDFCECGAALQNGDMVFRSYEGGFLHADCVGEDRDSYVDLETGEPLALDQPLPKPFSYEVP